MIKIISFKICPFVQRVTAALEAKNVPYEIEYISLKEPPDWFYDVSPNGQVPLLITESEAVLFESDAIIEYLDEVFPALQPELNAEQRAMERAWSYQASKHYLVQCSAMQSADAETLQMRRANLNKAFVRAEAMLGKEPYFSGASIGNVDIAWLPLLHRANIIEVETGFDFLEGNPKVKKWQMAMMQTGLAQRSVSSDFDNAFADFYLSEKTVLGKMTQGLSNESEPSLAASDNECCG
ncbi:MAG: glutathione S-transferase family protein [Pseudomonadota bacterium]